MSTYIGPRCRAQRWWCVRQRRPDRGHIHHPVAGLRHLSCRAGDAGHRQRGQRDLRGRGRQRERRRRSDRERLRAEHRRWGRHRRHASVGRALRATFLPHTTASSSCDGGALGGDTFGSTSSTSGEYVGVLFFNQSDSDVGLRSDFTRGRLQVTCRGSGTIEIVDSCSTPVATVNCSGGARPWTATSAEFSLATAANWNLRVTASTGSIQWASPQVLLY